MLKFAAVLILLLDVVFGMGPFNCTRPGMGCYNYGMCDEVNGGCICMGTTYTGFDCSLPVQSMQQGACLSAPIDFCNNGTCYDMAVAGVPGVAQCYCTNEFYGEHCEMKRAEAQCFKDEMVININPPGNFTGSVGILYTITTNVTGPTGAITTQTTTSLCKFARVEDQPMFTMNPGYSMWQGFATSLPFAGGVCGIGPKVNTTATEIIYTYDVTVRYSEADPSLDEIVSFSCPTPNAPGGYISNTAVLFSVADATGAMVMRPKLGSLVTITFSVDPTSIFTDVTVKSCTVFNSQRTASKPLVVDSCAVKPFGVSLVKVGDKHVLHMEVHAFGVHDPNLNFECAVKVCTVSDTSCRKLPVCPVLHGGGPHDPHGNTSMPHDPHMAGPHGHGAGPYDPHMAGPHGHGPNDPHAQAASHHGLGYDPYAQAPGPHGHGSGPHGAAPHSPAYGGPSNSELLSMVGMDPNSMAGASSMNNLLSGAGGSNPMGSMQDFFGPSTGGGMGGTGGGTGSGTTDILGALTGGAYSGGADLISSLMGPGGSSSLGSSVMNDLLFSGGGGAGGVNMGSPGIPHGHMGGYVGRRRRDVREDEAGGEENIVIVRASL